MRFFVFDVVYYMKNLFSFVIAGCNFKFYSYLRHVFNYKGNFKNKSKKIQNI